MQDKLAATGTLVVSFGSAQVAGTVAPDGSLTIAGDVRMAPYTISVGEWSSTIRTAPVPPGGSSDQMSGVFGLTWKADGSAGVAHMLAATDNLTRAVP
jgi:hypothetical protein